MTESSDYLTRLREQRRDAAAFAATLVGLPYSSAEDHAARHGYRAARLTPEQTVVTADLDVRRIRLVVDADDKVTRANAG